MGLIDRNGVWYFALKLGKKLHRKSTGFPVGPKANRQAALRRAAELELEIRSSRAGWSREIPTFAEYWKKTYEPTYTRQKRAGRLDRQIMAHALPVFGSVRLDDVTPSACEQYLATRRLALCGNPKRATPKRISEGTVQRERSFLHTFFRRAVDDQLIDRNPLKDIPRVPYAVKDRLLTDAEQVELLSRLSPRFQRFVLFLLGTGIRLEECRGIDPERDLDLERRRVTVTGKFGKTRVVPLPAELLDVIRQQLREDGGLWRQNQARLRDVLTTACKAVAPSPAGTRPQWQRKAQTGLPGLSPHVFRHTFGWRWLKGGGDALTLSRILGHASMAVTERHYAHLLAEDIQIKADRVDLGLGLKPKGKVVSIGGRA